MHSALSRAPRSPKAHLADKDKITPRLVGAAFSASPFGSASLFRGKAFEPFYQ